MCATLDAFPRRCQAATRPTNEQEERSDYRKAEPPAPELPPRPLPPRPRGLDPPVVVRVPRPPGFRCGGRRYSDPPAPLPGQSPSRPTAPAVASLSPPSRTGSVLARGRPCLGEAAAPGAARVRRRGAAAAAHHGGRESEEDDNESMEAPGRRRGRSPSEASTENIVFRAVPVPRRLWASF